MKSCGYASATMSGIVSVVWALQCDGSAKPASELADATVVDHGDASGEDASPRGGAGGAASGGVTQGGGAGAPAGGFGGSGATSTDAATGPCNGDGVVDPGETCDDGNDDEGDGCRSDCTWTCDPEQPPGQSVCNDGVACNGREVCRADHRCVPGSPLPNGTRCGDSVECVDGLCVFVHCGDGVPQPELGEECDDGNHIRGDGCEPDCRWTCLPADGSRSCRRTDPCHEVPRCIIATHLCGFAAPLPDGAPCPDGTCQSGACTPS